MLNEPENDYLARAKARNQICEQEYEAGRILQGLHRAAEEGDAEAVKILDGLEQKLEEKDALGWRGYELVKDVLLNVKEAPGLPSPLAQAAAKRGLNLATSSRDMKKLGRELRHFLGVMWLQMNSFVTRRPMRRALSGQSYYTPYLGGVKISAPGSESLDRFNAVQALAHTQGLHIDPTIDGEDFSDERFDVLSMKGERTNYLNKRLPEIEAALKRTELARPQRRRRGARGRAPVTLAKHA